MDCPRGQDEMDYNEYSCRNKFKCKGMKHCVHTKDICDGVVQWADGVDEKPCDIRTCLSNCLSLKYAIHCAQPRISQIDNVDYFPHFYVSMSMLHVRPFMLQTLNGNLTSLCFYILI